MSAAIIAAARNHPGKPFDAADGFTYFVPARKGEGPKEVIHAEYRSNLSNKPNFHRSTNPVWVVGKGVYRWPTLQGIKFDNSTPATWEDSDGSLPSDDASRLDFPMFDGLLAYFPNALAEVARISKIGNDQHNPGQPMHWARGKSTDHANKAIRHLADYGKKDSRGARHTARAAWRLLALLQEEIEADEGVPLSRASRPPEETA